MKLIEPTTEYEREIAAYQQEFLEEGGSMDGCGPLRRMENIGEWIEFAQAGKYRENVRPDLVPATQYIYVRETDNKVVGMIQIRHFFNALLERYGGHIGYSVRPSERQKGYATEMLCLALDTCRALGIERVLISCVEGNEGSRRTILKNGGVYESTVFWPERNVRIERYWIDLSGRG